MDSFKHLDKKKGNASALKEMVSNYIPKVLVEC